MESRDLHLLLRDSHGVELLGAIVAGGGIICGRETAGAAYVPVFQFGEHHRTAFRSREKMFVHVHCHGLNAGHAIAHDVELLGSCHREVNYCASAEGSAISHFHDYLLAVLWVGNPQKGAEGQGAVCAGQTVFMINFTTTGSSAMPAIAIVGSVAAHGLSQGFYRTAKGKCQCSNYGYKILHSVML